MIRNIDGKPSGHYCLTHHQQCQIASRRVISWKPPFPDVSPL